MISQLISHIWKKEFRSPVWAKSLLTNIFLGFAALMMLGYVLIAGVAMDKLVREFFPDSDPLVFINGFILYYFLVEFMLRFFLQNVPVLEIQPYLHLPIKKGKIIHFMFRKSLFSAFNLLAVLLFLPFSLMRVGADYGAVSALGWLASIVGLSITLHFVVILFKKKMNDIPNLFIGLIVFLAALAALDYFNVVSFSSLSSAVFGFIVEEPALGAIPVVLAFVFYRLNYSFLVKNTYPEELAIRKKEKVTGDFGFLKQYGRIGELIQLELKLILRHKRPRNTLIMSGWKIVLINLAAYLFNIGLNVFAVMRLAMFNPKKIDLNKGAAFNYEGVGAAQFLIMIPMMILPYILYAPFLILGYENLGLFLTGLAGLIGFLFRDKMLNALTQFFISRRHKFAASFRSQ